MHILLSHATMKTCADIVLGIFHTCVQQLHACLILCEWSVSCNVHCADTSQHLWLCHEGFKMVGPKGIMFQYFKIKSEIAIWLVFWNVFPRYCKAFFSGEVLEKHTRNLTNWTRFCSLWIHFVDQADKVPLHISIVRAVIRVRITYSLDFV